MSWRIAILALALGGLADVESFFALHDRNRDGRIVKQELQDDELFQVLDRDHDGGIGLRELRQALKYVTPELAARLEDPKQAWQRALDGASPALFDRDQDGALAPRELAAMLFEQVDVDQSGFLDADEITLLPFEMDGGHAKLRLARADFTIPREAFALLDANKDGKLTPDEFPWPRPVPLPPLVVRDLAEYWRSIDKDGDGKVTKRELPLRLDLFRAFDPKAQGFLKLDSLKGSRGEDLFDTARRSDDAFMVRYDLNGDGVVEPSEFPGPRSFFDRLDRNGDGKYDRQDRGPQGEKSAAGVKAEKKWGR